MLAELLTTAAEGGDGASIMVVILAIICTIFSWTATIACMIEHINHWNSPAHQRIIIQMLSLVLIWSLFATLVVIRPQVGAISFLLFLLLFYLLFSYETSFLFSFFFFLFFSFCDSKLVYITKFFMDTYEAYVVVLFMSLMCVYLGGDDVVPEVITKMPPFKMLPCLKMQPRQSVFTFLKIVIYQFAFFKPALSLLQCVLHYAVVIVPSLNVNQNLISQVFYLITLVSLIVAMLGLLKFYQMFSVALGQYKVASKFAAVKLFILLHLLQGIIMGLFATPENHNQVYQLEYFTLCFEMAVAAVLLKYVVFTYREFLSEGNPVKPWLEYFRLDEARLTEWKSVLQSPHIVRQDSFYPENANRHSLRSYQSQSNYSTMINNVYY